MYYLILIVTFLGLGGGWLLTRIAWDEVTQYKVFLKWLKIAVLISCATLMFLYSTAWATISTLLLLILMILGKDAFVYSFLPALLWLSWNTYAFPYVASLVLLYGFPYASMIARESKKGKSIDTLILILRNNYAYLVIGVSLGIIL